MEQGWDLAVEVVQKRERRKHAASQQQPGRPVYGMPGTRVPERG